MFNSTAKQFISKKMGLRLYFNPKCGFTHSVFLHMVCCIMC